jgi:hypothetical protein
LRDPLLFTQAWLSIDVDATRAVGVYNGEVFQVQAVGWSDLLGSRPFILINEKIIPS